MHKSNIKEPKQFCYITPLPAGKKRLGDGDQIKIQAAQKGPNCWYYTANHLRLRYGKNVSRDHAGRRIEIIASEFRKALCLIDELPNVYMLLKRSYCKKNIMLRHFQKMNIDSPRSLPVAQAQLLKEALHAFSSQREYESMDDFLILYIKKLREKAAAIALKKFEVSEAEINEYLSRYRQASRPAALVAFTKVKILYLLGLQKTTWEPTDGFDGIYKTLKKYGPCYVSGLFGVSYFKVRQKTNDKIANYEVYQLSDYHKREDGHAVLLVGASVDENDLYVYIIDPTDAIHPEETNKIYKFPYDILVNNIKMVNGHSYSEAHGQINPSLLHNQNLTKSLTYNNKMTHGFFKGANEDEKLLLPSLQKLTLQR